MRRAGGHDPRPDRRPPRPAPAEPCPLDRIVPDAARLLRDHAAIHGDLSGRVRLRLGGRDARPGSEDLLARGGPELVEAVFAAARYAIVSSVGELPPTLQGVWSGTFRPPWQSGYTLDGNLQAAVAGLLVTGTPELLLPVFDLLERLLPDFRDNARRLYGCRGILVPAHVSTHGRHNHFHPTWCLTFWTAGAAWLSRLYYDYYDHTGDLGFLRERALPFMTEAAEFYEDFLDEHGNFAPSYSPENAPSGGDAQACVNATMDIAAVRDLLRNLVRAHGESSLDARRWQALRDRLPAYRIAPTGELSEWAPPPGLTLEDDHAHRHASHLYPFWYDTGEAADPALRAAGAEAVRRRLEWWRGAESDEMAFGLVQLGLAAANLGMAAEASQALDLLVTRYWRANMVSTHNRDAIFNVDVCGGVPALVAAMLVRSRATASTCSRPAPGRPARCAACAPGAESSSSASPGPPRASRPSWPAPPPAASPSPPPGPAADGDGCRGRCGRGTRTWFVRWCFRSRWRRTW
ncbi:glycosyl hydrolase family 95 catalytic domain-containing protein [Microbispora sp. H10836]|uniref:glycosyl hydrolase family 95 catalytic domain-containing protein n=1 Tax=Microbispora sp. H10836 TaxID=2729106 RepID=UPI0020162F98|nr:hypothetical protein [Microbispora sp. H10836]